MTSPFVEVVPEAELQSRVAQLGAVISDEYAERRPVLVGVLKGAAVFLADLLRQVTVEVDVDFLSLTRFGSEGRVSIAMDTSVPLLDRHVILVEGILVQAVADGVEGVLNEGLQHHLFLGRVLEKVRS